MTEALQKLSVEWTRRGAEAPAAAAKAMTTASLLLVGYIKREKLSGNPINRRSGNLSSHVGYELQPPTTESVTSKIGVLGGVPYARGLEEGNPPHIIRPRMGLVDFSTDHYSNRQRALRFKMGGEWVFTRQVNHPGNRAFRFIRGSLEENTDKIKGIFAKAMRDNTEGKTDAT